jgi:hypothetical protein
MGKIAVLQSSQYGRDGSDAVGGDWLWQAGWEVGPVGVRRIRSSCQSSKNPKHHGLAHRKVELKNVS